MLPSGPASEFPLVTVVTPCLNAAAYLEETIRSVLDQDYPNLEYLVVDGGSTDGTLEILKKYSGRLRWESGPDRGAADALNRGFRLSRGLIWAYLNADDTYFPGAISAAVRRLRDHPGVAAVYGEAIWVASDGAILGRYPTRPFDPARLSRECYICQPAVFLRREVLEASGGFDPELQYAFDYDLWVRIARSHTMLKIDELLATSRMHRENKTLGQRRQVFRETMRTFRRHYGYVPFQWVYGYCCYLVDRRDQFFEPLRPSIFKYLLSLLLGSWHNRGSLRRYWREWRQVMTLGGLIRRWNASGFARILGLRFRER